MPLPRSKADLGALLQALLPALPEAEGRAAAPLVERLVAELELLGAEEGPMSPGEEEQRSDPLEESRLGRAAAPVSPFSVCSASPIAAATSPKPVPGTEPAVCSRRRRLRPAGHICPWCALLPRAPPGGHGCWCDTAQLPIFLTVTARDVQLAAGRLAAAPRWRSTNRARLNEDAPETAEQCTNRQRRLVLYYKVFLFFYGELEACRGKGNRRTLPSCIRARLLAHYPDDDIDRAVAAALADSDEYVPGDEDGEYDPDDDYQFMLRYWN